MVPRLFVSFLLLLAIAPAQVAQAPRPPALPRLMRLGPMPTAAAALTLQADGSLFGTKGERLEPGQLAAAIAADTKDLVLRVDRRAPASAVLAVLDTARARGVATVHFAATLPNGTPGALALAMPTAEQVATTMDLRLHHQRSGVPPSSVEPLLQRMQQGWQTAKKVPFVLGVHVTGAAMCEQMLQVLGAIAAAGVQQVVVTSTSAAEPEVMAATTAALGALAANAATELDGALALDFGPVPQIQVQGASLPQPRPSVQATPFGCLERAQNTAVELQPGGAGGLYGGRTGGRIGKGGHPAIAEAIGSGLARLTSQQHADGSFGSDDGRGDMEATALCMLALLGDGRLDAGPEAGVLQRGVGWILSQQHADGAFVDGAPGSIGQHALATYALVETAGLSTRGALLRGSAQAGLDWLFARRQVDGGWNNGLQGVVSDPMSTAQSIAAVASAEFFGFTVPARAAELVGWFDGMIVTDTAPTAAALFTRFFAGQDPRGTPSMSTMAEELLTNADPSDPWGAYWTTYALHQFGGRHWAAWLMKVDLAIANTQIRGSDLDGFWEPAGGCPRLTTTALRLLTLEAYYRHSKLVR